MSGKERGTVARYVGARRVANNLSPIDWRHVFQCWMRATPPLDRIEYADVLAYPHQGGAFDYVGNVCIVLRKDVEP